MLSALSAYPPAIGYCLVAREPYDMACLVKIRPKHQVCIGLENKNNEVEFPTARHCPGMQTRGMAKQEYKENTLTILLLVHREPIFGPAMNR